MTDLPRPVAELVEVLSAMPGVIAVALGGSRALGGGDAGSDWDLGLYYRGTVDLFALAARTTVYPPGAWGRLMNGGAWVRCGREEVDVLLRDLDVVEHWTRRAEQGEFEVDPLLGYLAGAPTYLLSAELAAAGVSAVNRVHPWMQVGFRRNLAVRRRVSNLLGHGCSFSKRKRALSMKPELTESDRAGIAATARRHGIAVAGDVEVNDIGLDFRVAFVADAEGGEWVLRLPRRPDVLPRAENEMRVLRLLRTRLPVAVPDWTVFTPELIAYPRLPGTIALVLDPATGQPRWNIDLDSPLFTRSLASTLAALHGIAPAEAAGAGLKVTSAEGVRRATAEAIERVRREVGVGEGLHRRWQTWLDDDASWPPFTALVHGDLYAGHVLVDETGRATGVIDWTEAEVADPSVDFVFHLMAFGEVGLEQLLGEYEAAGGRVWPGLRRHVADRLSANPVKYALFALESGSNEHLAAAKAQLGVAVS
jgi:macrolide phosphotransferase